jgi:hypothetical protein
MLSSVGLAMMFDGIPPDRESAAEAHEVFAGAARSVTSTIRQRTTSMVRTDQFLTSISSAWQGAEVTAKGSLN